MSGLSPTLLLAANPGQLSVYVIAGYLLMLLALAWLSNRFFRGTATDYFTASHGVGPVFLLLTLFGTTMTAFALIGSSREAFVGGIGVYGKMVSWSGLIHSLCFFLIGIKVWSYGRRYGYVTQIQYFRARFESNNLGLLLFPVLVGLVVPYLLIGVIGGGLAIQTVTSGAFPETFSESKGGIPFWIGALAICLVVLVYVFFGGVRGTTWANSLQTLIFIVLGGVTFWVISDKLGGVQSATQMVIDHNPAHLKVGATEADEAVYESQLAAFEAGSSPIKPRAPKRIPPLVFLTYAFVPLSVAMFPHLFQHWLTAQRASNFKLAVIVHPLLMLMVWVPCVLIGVWATSAIVDGQAVVPPDFARANAVLPLMVRKLSTPIMGALLTAGVLAAIMSSLDSQFLCISSIFSNDVVAHYLGRDRLTDAQRLLWGRVFVVLVVAASYGISLRIPGASVFSLAVWCFSGFAALSPLIFGALYWKRATKLGAYACVLVAAVLWVLFFYDAQTGNVGLAERLPHTGREGGEYLVLGMMPVATMIIGSTLALVVVSLMTPRPSAATIDKFFTPRVGSTA